MAEVEYDVFCDVAEHEVEEWYEFYPAGAYDLGDGEDPAECPEGFYAFDEEDEAWYLLGADGEAYELEVE